MMMTMTHGARAQGTNANVSNCSVCTFCALLRPRSDHRLRATGGRRRTARPSCPTPRCLGGNSLPRCQSLLLRVYVVGLPNVDGNGNGNLARRQEKHAAERGFPESLGVNGSFSSVTPPGPDVLLLCLAFLRCIRLLLVTGAAPVFFVAAAVALSPSARSPVVTSSRLAGLAAIADPITAPFCSRPHRPFLFSLSYSSVCLGPGLMYSSRRTPISFFSVLAPSR